MKPSPAESARFTASAHGGGGKPRLLDLFCCAGGAAVGYARAGFEVVGVDIAPQPRITGRRRSFVSNILWGLGLLLMTGGIVSAGVGGMMLSKGHRGMCNALTLAAMVLVFGGGALWSLT